MDYSTAVTERLVKMVLEDVIKVVVDYNGKKTDKQKDKQVSQVSHKGFTVKTIM